MSIGEPYADAELAALYDLEHDAFTDDLAMYEGFARRGDGATLELGAGTGRVAAHLASLALPVVAAEASKAMLERGRTRAADGGRFIEGDMRSLDLSEQRFGLSFCALSTFEHMLTLEDQRAVLACVRAHLSDGGVFVADLRAPRAIDWAADGSQLTHEWTRSDPASGDVVTKTVALRASQADGTTTATMIYDRTPATGGPVHRRMVEVTLRAFTRREIELLLAGAVLRLTAIYGDYGLSPFDDGSDRMIIVAERA